MKKLFFFSGFVKRVSSNLVDNVNIFNTDLDVIFSAEILVPSTKDLVSFAGNTYKIISVLPLGILDNETTLYELIVRLA